MQSSLSGAGTVQGAQSGISAEQHLGVRASAGGWSRGVNGGERCRVGLRVVHSEGGFKMDVARDVQGSGRCTPGK
eukprot:3404254-Prymnesium_polylepis.1